ncbi:hypothetical protein DsansV1_C19g0157921 [Dioscorea sansibarensis]
MPSTNSPHQYTGAGISFLIKALTCLDSLRRVLVLLKRGMRYIREKNSSGKVLDWSEEELKCREED